MTAVSASLPTRERTDARQFAPIRQLPHIEVCTDDLDRPDYVRNGRDRCFHCKSALMDALAPVAARDGCPCRTWRQSGRPGGPPAWSACRGSTRRRIPLVDDGLTKADVRALSRELGLPTAAKPAAACLSSRVAYGDPVTAQMLAWIEQAEKLLKDRGIAQSRVRAHAGGSVARVEVPAGEFAGLLDCRDELVRAFRQAGFTLVTLDLAGLRSGSMNLLLDGSRGHTMPGDGP